MPWRSIQEKYEGSRMLKSQTKTHLRLVFILENSLSSNRKIILNINTKVVQMPNIIAMDWQVARQLEIRVLDAVMQVGFTESKDARVVLEHKCFSEIYT